MIKKDMGFNSSNKKGILFVVATPIGNLEDITLRALKTFQEVDLIVSEDTRATRKLLFHFQIKKPTISYHQHSREKRIQWIINQLKARKKIALVSEAGTPGISDPGNILVERARKEKIKIIPIPGPSALITLGSVSGINLQKFLFLGFPPKKKGRKKFFQEIANSQYPVIYYESPYRFLKNLKILITLAPEKQIIVGRELTKVFEEIIKGRVQEVFNYFSLWPEKLKGEFVIIIY